MIAAAIGFDHGIAGGFITGVQFVVAVVGMRKKIEALRYRWVVDVDETLVSRRKRRPPGMGGRRWIGTDSCLGRLIRSQ
jgi:hypothetical protein